MNEFLDEMGAEQRTELKWLSLLYPAFIHSSWGWTPVGWARSLKTLDIVNCVIKVTVTWEEASWEQVPRLRGEQC